MPKSITERRLVDVLMCHFGKLHATKREVRHYERSIDVLAVCDCDEEVWAIEAKVAAWTRALSQAIVNLAAAQRSYIAIYAKNAHRVDLERLDRYGIGLIAVGSQWGQVEVLKEAKLSQYTNNKAVNQIRQQVVKGRR
jgi:hypothetical protein